ncbi:MAG: cation:proton antiporter, partial [Bacteroidota bacterium]|nr:cation:proton antiporter [Bacteroidota bacterium]
MKKYRNLLFYIGVTGGASVILYWIVIFGHNLEIGRNILVPSSGKSNWNEFLVSFSHNLQHPLAILLVQIVTIIFAARLFGWICRKIGQPTVMGEIIAGIVLGPSVLGMYFPGVSSTLFPIQS